MAAGHRERLLLDYPRVKNISTFAVNDPENRPTSDSIGPGEIKRNSNKSKSTEPAGALRAGLNQTLFVLANYGPCFCTLPRLDARKCKWDAI